MIHNIEYMQLGNEVRYLLDRLTMQTKSHVCCHLVFELKTCVIFYRHHFWIHYITYIGVSRLFVIMSTYRNVKLFL